MGRRKKGPPRNPLGYRGPWSWAFEPVRGCNLKCAHCVARDIPHGKYEYMSEDVLRVLCHVMAEVSPKAKVDMAQCGEPTLHPRLLDFLSIARDLSPWTQYQVTTNGTKLRTGEITFNDLFDAGANIVYVDMYGGPERFYQLAIEAWAKDFEIEWFFYHPEHHADKFRTLKNVDETTSPWTYIGPERKTIVLMDPPEAWPKSRLSAGRLGGFLNNLTFDEEARDRFNMFPVEEPLPKSCAQLDRYSVTDYLGNYVLCCQDFVGETAGRYGDVFDGVDGWYRYWFGKERQLHRRWLRMKDRSRSPYCSRCDANYSTRPARMFTEEDLSWHLDENGDWRPLPWAEDEFFPTKGGSK